MIILKQISEEIPAFIEKEFRSFLKCGILAYGFKEGLPLLYLTLDSII